MLDFLLTFLFSTADKRQKNLPLVELPSVNDGDGHAIRLLQSVPKRTNSALQARCVCNIKLKIVFSEQLAGAGCLDLPLGG